jgi:sugar/nucleoside kinase (ribokinase family)
MPRKRKSRAGVLVFGDINVDIHSRLNAFQGLGTDYLVPALKLNCGGVGANTALALGRWGVPVRVLGAVGRDPLGEFLLGRLRQEGVEISLVQQVEGALTGLMFTVISRKGERTFFGSRGANAEVRTPGGRRTWLSAVGAVHLMGYNFLSPSATATARQLLRQARRLGLSVSLDVGMAPARQAGRTILQVARRADILFLSRDEARALTGRRNPRQALQALEELGAPQVILKLGPRGCLFREQDRLRNVPAFPVTVTDTTGCGDAFTAAFLYAHLSGWPNEEAALLANAAGATAATVVGAGEQLPGPAQVLRLLSRRLAPPWEEVRRCVLQRLKKEQR